VADRFKKARTILDLMMEKLPVSILPFVVQMGEQAANIYYNLGKVSGDKSSIEMSNKILEDEIMRYAGYLRFYQSLDADQYSRLTRADKFVDQQYLVFMLHDYYRQCGEKKYNEIMAKLQAAGVNMDRLQAYQSSYEQAVMQQEEAAAAQAEESSVSLEEALGN
jgi:hypothetical protein